MRLTDEHWKENLVGETLDERLSKAIHQRYLEEIEEITPPGMKDFSIVTATKPDKTIRNIGFSVPGDLILDNFGKWWCGVIGPTWGGYNNCSYNSLIDISNTSRQLIMRGYNGTAYWGRGNLGCGCKFQMGSGTTAPQRSNYNIETALATAPENAMFIPSNASYAAGTMVQTGAITAGGTGTVNEACAFLMFMTTSYASHYYMMFRDSIVPGVPYVANDILTQTLTLTL